MSETINADPVVCISCEGIYDAEEARWFRWRKDCCSERCAEQQNADEGLKITKYEPPHCGKAKEQRNDEFRN